jgi:D-alanine--poly(phosphoribitol) ligase subunit 2
MNDVEQSILDHIRGVAAASNVNVDRDTGLLETGLLDSINLVGLIQFLEERFSIRIPDSDIGADLFESPATLVSYVEKRLGASAAPAKNRVTA